MLVTTVIPTFNRAADVVVAVTSALSQTYPAELHEVIVVDDGSSDDTADVLKQFGDRIRYIRKSNAGVSAARNLGIAEARGASIAFLDSDDAWECDKIALQAELLKNRPEIGLVLTSMSVFNAERIRIGSFSRRSTIPVDGNVLRFALMNPAMTPSSAMVRTEIARQVGGFDEDLRTAEDLDFHLKVALTHGVAVIDQPLLRYTRADNSLGASIRTYHDYITVITRFIDAHRDRISSVERKRALFTAYVKNGSGLAAAGRPASAIAMALHGVRYMSGTDQLSALARFARQLARSAAARAWHRFAPAGAARR